MMLLDDPTELDDGCLFVTEAVWQTYRDLGNTAFEMGQLDLAVKLFRAALKHVRQSDNSELRMGAIASDLSVVYCKQQKYKEATALLRQVISLYERLLGLEHPFLAGLICDLAFVYASRGRGPYCARMYKRAQEMLNRTMPEGCSQLREAMMSVGSALSIEEKCRQAELFFNRESDQEDCSADFPFPSVGAGVAFAY